MQNWPGICHMWLGSKLDLIINLKAALSKTLLKSEGTEKLHRFQPIMYYLRQPQILWTEFFILDILPKIKYILVNNRESYWPYVTSSIAGDNQYFSEYNHALFFHFIPTSWVRSCAPTIHVGGLILLNFKNHH